MNTIRALLLSVGLVAMAHAPAAAQVSDAMDRYYEASKGMSRYTGPGSYEGQTRTAMTMGSYGWRAPQGSVQIASYKLPSASAGCGGIDMYSGGFSYINGDQIKNMMRNIVQNAKGFAFKLAVDAISSQISEQLENMDAKLQDINGLMADSCAAAETLVNTASVRIQGAVRNDCHVSESAQGGVKDWFSATLSCSDASSGGVAPPAPEDGDKGVFDVTNRNLSWIASSHHDDYKDNTLMREFLMTVSGTIIVRQEGSGASERTVTQAIPSLALNTGVLTSLLHGGDIAVHKCLEGKDCLEVQQNGTTVTITPDMAYSKRVHATLMEIIDEMAKPDGVFKPEHEEFVNRTGIQVYSLLRELVDRDKRIAVDFAYSMTDLIATEMVLGFMIEQTSEMQMHGEVLLMEGVDEALRESWMANLRYNQDVLRTMKQEQTQKAVMNSNSIEMLSTLRQANASSLMQVLFEP